MAESVALSRYYTAFVYGALQVGPVLEIGHCTHKFLGLLTDKQVDEVFGICDSFFNEWTSPEFPYTHFTVPEWFTAKGKPVKVLTPERVDLAQWFPLLRSTLDAYRKDDYTYRPHVTNPKAKRLECPFYGYALINGSRNEVEHYWRNYGTS